MHQHHEHAKELGARGLVLALCMHDLALLALLVAFCGGFFVSAYPFTGQTPALG